MKAIPIEISQMATGRFKSWNRALVDLISREITTLTRYYDDVVIVPDSIKNGDSIHVSDAQEPTKRTAILFNGTFNFHFDIEGLLRELKPRLSRNSRVIAICYNPYLAWLYRLANAVGLRKGPLPTTFLTRTDLANIAKLAGFEVVRIRVAGFVPFKFFGLGSLVNSLFASLPFVRWFAYTNIAVLRPIVVSEQKPSLTVVIPARNEKGNIQGALDRMPDLGCKIEVIFVEGHSSDGTWEEIQRVTSAYKGPLELSAYRQTGKGKADAVRLGFSKAKGDLLTILDADLTMPPELLGRFYDAYTLGRADFVNGTRLVYPMEGEAMRFLNRLGNIFFAKALSSVLDTRLGDSLCGTKLVARHDYDRFIRWRKDFGNFDPFGDFELLFPAAVLGLGVVDIPIRYRARTYGTTNISRFRHGFMLLRMTLIGFFKIRMGR